MSRDSRPILITISNSHYCEKARWALDRLGVAYREEAHVPLVSRLAGLRRGVWHTVPILVTADGVVRDSTAILRWAEARSRGGGRLYPEDPTALDEVDGLEERFDTALGPHTRRLAYSWLLPHRALALGALGGVPLVEQVTTRALYPVVRKVMERGLGIDAAGVERSRRKIDEVFAEVGERIADGRRYLVGDRFTAADLAFASLAAPVLLPPEYGAKLPSIEVLPAPIRAEVERLRETAAGRFALRLYAEERRGGAGTQGSTVGAGRA